MLGKGRMIALMINGGEEGGVEKHWIRLEELRCTSKGRLLSVIGDPWTGKSWAVPANVIRRRVLAVVVAKKSP
jgi:hypothetical protein